MRVLVALTVAIMACDKEEAAPVSSGDVASMDVAPPDVVAGEPWRELAGPGPGARWGHVGVLDGKRRRMIVWGGTDAAGKKADAWALSLEGETWEALATTGGPTARYTSGAVADGARDRMVLVGGDDGNARGDVWALDFATHTWTELSSGPAPRFDVAAAAAGDKAWFFGGFLQGFVAVGDLWELDLVADSWRELPAKDPRPSPRTNVGFGAHLGNVWVVGGHDAAELTADVWRYDLAKEQWLPVTPSGGLAGWAHFAYGLDAACGVLWLAGADNNDTTEVPLASGLVLGGAPRFVDAPFASPPPVRRHAVMIVDSAARRIVVMGGAQGQAVVHGDTWISPALACP